MPKRLGIAVILYLAFMSSSSPLICDTLEKSRLVKFQKVPLVF